MTPVLARVRANVRLDKLASLGARHSSLLALFFAALAAAPLFSNPGFLSTRGGGDSPFLLLRLHQLLAALQSGQFPVRWMPDADFGYGYPFFNYYAAFPYYLAALLKLYGFSFVFSLKLTQFAALLVAAAGVYAWARSLKLSLAQAMLASAAYSFAPFHLVNLYVRGDSLSELWAMAWYPLVLWRAQLCFEKNSAGRAFGLALCTALLIWTHNISALNFMPFLGLYLLLGMFGSIETKLANSARFASALKNAGVGVAALAWGLALSAFFWLPALSETQYVQIGDVTQGYFFYGSHFRSTDLIQPSAFFNFEPVTGQPTPFSMGLVQAVFTFAGLAVLAWQAVRHRRWSWVETFVVLGLALSTWMITPASRWVWEYAPLVKYTQFPWRFLSIQSLFAALVIARVIPVETANIKLGVGSWKLGVGSWKLGVGTAFLLSSSVALFTLGGLRPDFIPLTDADVTSERLRLYELFTANIGSTIGYEYLPRAVQPRPYTSDVELGRPPRLKVLRGAASGAQVWKRGASERWTIEVTSGPATVALPTHYWPGWSAEAQGQPLAVRAAEGLGWIALDLPPGQHTVTLWLGRTPLRATTEVLSSLALVIPGVIWLFRTVRGEREDLRVRLRPWIVGFGVWALGFFALRVLPAPPESTLPLSMDFIQLPYPHHAAIRFADGTQLVQIEYNANHLARGEVLEVETQWQVAGPGQARFYLVPQSNLLAPAPITLTLATVPLASAPSPLSHSFSLSIPEDIPPGSYFLMLQHSSGSALTSAGRTRGPVQLGPIWVDDSGPSGPVPDLPLQDFGPAIRLLAATTETAAPGALRVNLLWNALADVPHNDLLALRLRDVAGNEWSAFDTQTGGGYYPTHMWEPGEVIPDGYDLRLPDGMPPGDYLLTIALYDPLALTALGETTITATVLTTTPIGNRPAHFQLSPDVALEAVDFPDQVTQGDAPELAAHWLTLAALSENYRARWTLTASDGTRVTQTLDLAPGSKPSTWPADAYMLGRVRLPIPLGLAPGEYSLSVHLLDEQGQEVGPPVLVRNVRVLGRPRVFEAPPMQAAVGATFGDKLKLWGYDTERADSELRLTLVWGALAEPRADYKFFVHLFNPADEFVVKQVDAMPRNFTYPTALWAAGEVVTDTITFSLADVPPGTYRLAVGWYDPASPENRLPAFDVQGQRLELDRVILPLTVTAP